MDTPSASAMPGIGADWPILRGDQADIIARVTNAATIAARELLATRRLAVAVTIEPGDDTRYELFVSAPGAPRVDATSGGTLHGDYTPSWFVAVAVGDRCHAWRWDGAAVHPHRASQRWAPGEAWTGLVVAAFLAAFSHRLAEIEQAEAREVA